jgi:dipeptidyl aminopeptidase/acylaminoacyl peptidase
MSGERELFFCRGGEGVKPEDIFEIVTWGEIAPHPHRPRIYFTERRLSRESNRAETHIRALEMQSLSHAAVTRGVDDSRPVPSPDGKLLAFLSRRSSSRQVWLLPIDGGEARQLSAIQGGVSDLSWAPDCTGMVVAAHIERGLLVSEHAPEEPNSGASDAVLEEWHNRDVKHITQYTYKMDGTGFFDDGRDQLVHVDLQGRPTLMTNGYHNYSHPVFAPDGTVYALRRAYDPERLPPSLTDVVVFRQNKDGWSWEALPIEGLAITSLAVAADGRSLAFYAANPADDGYGNTLLCAWDLESQVLHELSASADRPAGDESGSDVPIASSARPQWHQGVWWSLLSHEGRVSVASFDNGAPPRIVQPQDRVVADFAQAGNCLALAVSDPVHPAGLVLVDQDAQERVLWAPTPWTEEVGPVAPEAFWAQSPDGTRVQGWCMLPRGEASSHPALLEIHGGPMSMYGFRYHHEFQCLAAAGYAVVYSNPRGSVGFGKDFCSAIKGRWGDKDYQDVIAAMDYGLAHYPLDSGRLGVLGGSYGGFMVNWIVSHTDRFKAAVTMRSVVNRFSAMGSSDVGKLRVSQYSAGPWWEEPAPYWQQSPLKYASNIHTPLLIEHQEQDYRLPVEQGEQLYNALKFLGRPVELVLYPNESHGMSRTGRPWHRVHRLKTIVNWFDRHLADASASPQ